jgi:integrase
MAKREPGIYERTTRQGETVFDAVVTVQGRQKWSRGHRNRSEARHARDELRVQMRRGQLGTAPARLTLGEYIETRWLPYIQNELHSSESVRSYRSQVRHVVRLLGESRLASLTPLEVETFKADMRAEGVGEAMQNAAFDRLRQMLNQAVRWELIYRNPCASVTAPRDPGHDAPTLSNEAIAALLRAADETTQFGTLFYLAVMTGMRWGELTKLQWGDVDFGAGVLFIPRANTKTKAGKRPVALGRTTLERLQAHRYEQMRTFAAYGGQPPALVFTSVKGTALTQANFHRRVWGPLRDRLGLSGMHFHDLRHAQSSLMARAGVHPSVMMHRLGHSTALMSLDVYTQLSAEDQRAAAEALEGMIND